MDFTPETFASGRNFLNQNISEIKKNKEAAHYLMNRNENHNPASELQKLLEFLRKQGKQESIKENKNEVKKSPTSYEMMQNINEHLNQNNDQLTLKPSVNVLHKKTDDQSV